MLKLATELKAGAFLFTLGNESLISGYDLGGGANMPHLSTGSSHIQGSFKKKSFPVKGRFTTTDGYRLFRHKTLFYSSPDPGSCAGYPRPPITKLYFHLIPDPGS